MSEVNQVIRQDIVDEILAERRRQDGNGGPDREDVNSHTDWGACIMRRLLRIGFAPEQFRQLMIEIAALSIAAVESDDRKTELKSNSEG